MPFQMASDSSRALSVKTKNACCWITSETFWEFEFQGFIGKRRIVSYGWRYDFNGGG
jgi:hypothetical protein